MSSIIQKLKTNCLSCNVLLNDNNMVKNRKKCNKCPDNNRNKNEKPISRHVCEINTRIKTERTLVKVRSGCGKTPDVILITR